MQTIEEPPAADHRLSTTTHEFARQRVKYLVEEGGLADETRDAMTPPTSSYVRSAVILLLVGASTVCAWLLPSPIL